MLRPVTRASADMWVFICFILGQFWIFWGYTAKLIPQCNFSDWRHGLFECLDEAAIVDILVNLIDCWRNVKLAGCSILATGHSNVQCPISNIRLTSSSGFFLQFYGYRVVKKSIIWYNFCVAIQVWFIWLRFKKVVFRFKLHRCPTNGSK